MQLMFCAGLLINTCFNGAQAQETKKVKAWVVNYEMALDLPKKNTDELSDEDKKMIAMMELGKALSGAEEGRPLLKAYVTSNNMRVEQGGLLSSVQVSNLTDSTSYTLDSSSKIAYRVPLASPKISTEMVGDSLVVVSSADGKLRFTDDTITIANYICKKALMSISMGDNTQDIIIWYAENLPKLFWGEYDYLENIPGLPMKVSTLTHGMEVGIKVTSLSEELVDDALFRVPANYTVEDQLGELSEEELDTATTERVNVEEDFALAEGYHWTDDGELWGIEDDEGNVLVEPSYHDRFGYRFGLAPVSYNDRFGIINKVGKEIIPLEYEGAFVASESRIWIMKDSLYALIDTTNKMILSPLFQTGSFFVDGLAFAQRDEKYGFIDENGKEVIPFIYDDADVFVDGKAWVRQGEEEFYIDKNGNKAR